MENTIRKQDFKYHPRLAWKSVYYAKRLWLKSELKETSDAQHNMCLPCNPIQLQVHYDGLILDLSKYKDSSLLVKKLL